jgi:hypothetical protein
MPHIAVLQEARKICFKEGQDDWVKSAVEALRGLYFDSTFYITPL